jgi:glucose-6-phosphate isomerase, archaeal
MMSDIPFSFLLPSPQVIPSRVDNHIVRRLSQMRGQFLDPQAYEEQLRSGDSTIYEVYEVRRPEKEGELLSGISIVHPGKVGKEFFMTKGHFHAVLDTAEIYLCLRGEGVMVMENPEGESTVELLSPGKVLYVPPRWAHRSVCTSRLEDLVTFFIYPGNAGHDYGTIEQQGFRKLILDGPDEIQIVENPRWHNA